MISTDVAVDLVINKLTDAQYQQLSSQGLIDDNQLYLVPDDFTLSNYALSADVTRELAKKANASDIPTVNDAQITIKQGNDVKGTFTLNQSNDLTVQLSAGGGGGGDIPADLSVHHLSAYSIRMGGTAYDAQQTNAKNSIVMGSGSYAHSSDPDLDICSKLAIGCNAQVEGYNVFAIGEEVRANGNNIFAFGRDVGANSYNTFIWGGSNSSQHNVTDDGTFQIWSDVYDAKSVLRINGQTLEELISPTIYVHDYGGPDYSGSGYNYVSFPYQNYGKSYLVFGYFQCYQSSWDITIDTNVNGDHTTFKSVNETSNSYPIVPFSFPICKYNYYFYINSNVQVDMYITTMVELGDTYEQ